jgi:hypothetical protein
MWEDPIVADVRRIRQELSAKLDFNLAAIFADLRSRQASAGTRLVRLEENSGQGKHAQQQTHSVPRD